MLFSDSGILEVKPLAEKEQQTSILISGDFCVWDKNAHEKIKKGEAKEILGQFQNFIDETDLPIIQFETPLTNTNNPIAKSGPNLKCEPNTVDFLKAWGGKVTLLANNHIGDFGPDAVVETINILQKNGYKTAGAGKNIEDAYKPLILKINNLTIGILNFAENEFGSADTNKPGSAPLNPCLNVRQIMDLKTKVDFCLVILHGGTENNPVATPRLVEMCRTFASVGADMVVNIHTHCPEGIEVWNGVPIVYSIGNFYFPKENDENPYTPWHIGYSVRITIDRLKGLQLQIIPTRFTMDGSQIIVLEGKQRHQFFQHMQEISDILHDPKELRACYEHWVAISGYPKKLIDPFWQKEDFAAPAPNPKLMPLRDCFTCESHNHLITTYFRLVEEGRVEQAKNYQPPVLTITD